MAKFHCSCGWVMSNVSWPAEHEGRLIAEWAWDTASSYSGKQPDINSTVPCRNVMECRECGRIYIETEPESNKYISFMPESEKLRLMDKGHDEATEWFRNR